VERIITNDDLRRICKEHLVAYLRHNPNIYLDGLKKSSRCLIRKTCVTRRNSNIRSKDFLNASYAFSEGLPPLDILVKMSEACPLSLAMRNKVILLAKRNT
jgi:hypothetical protein